MSFGFFSNEDPHGRAWRHFRFSRWMVPVPYTYELNGREMEEEVHLVRLSGELVHGPHPLNGFGFKLSTTGEETLDLHYAVPWLRHYWSLDIYRRRDNKMRRLPGVRFTFDAHGTVLSWCIGKEDSSLNNGWRQRYISWGRDLMGKGGYSYEDLETVESEVCLPEGRYPVKVTLQHQTWTMGSRWPFSMRRRYEYLAHIESETGLPFPGKGENSWDCGGDHLYSCGCKVRKPYDLRDKQWVATAVGHAAGRVMEYRCRYGSDIYDTGRV